MMNREERATFDAELMPKYSLRVSARAKRLQLNVSAWGKVEVVVPRNVSLARVEPFVCKHRDWLLRTLEKLRNARDGGLAEEFILPAKVRLSALDENWLIDFRHGSRARVNISYSGEGRQLQVVSPDSASARAMLRNWCRGYAGRELIPWLKAVSDECGLPYARATVRAQKTRWGSCSARGHISLNWQLIFLPPALVRYLCIHELCHTVHLNHSKRYWDLVSRFSPQHAVHESDLRRAASYVPLWACPE